MTDSTCIVNTVEEWVNNNCTEFAQTQDQNFYNQLFGNFYSSVPQGVWVPGINNPSDEDLNFQYLLGQICNENQIGGKCKSLWTSRCSQYSRQDAENPIIRQFCGCYLPESEYNQNVERSCDLICSGLDTVKFFETPTSQNPQTCEDNICVIDDVTINAVNSNIGDIRFSQICRNCGPVSQCNCIISDINIISQDSRIGQLNLVQNCGGSIQCFARGSGGEQMEVNCNQYLGSLGTRAETIAEEKRRSTIYIIVFSIIALFILVLFIAAFYLYLRQPISTKVVKRTIVLPQKFGTS